MSYYTKEQLVSLIYQAEDTDREQIRKLSERKMVRESVVQYKIQEDIIREQYQQSHQYQEKILVTYRQLQQMEDPQKVSQVLLSQFEDDYQVVQNTAEQCIEWYYRTQNSAYFTVINLIFKQHNDFQECLQKKLTKDVRINHGKVYIVIKNLTPILDEQFLREIYQYVLLNYSFCYMYNFKGADNIIKSIYQLTDHKDCKSSQFMISVYEQRIVICDELFKLTIEQLSDSIQTTTEFLTPKLQFNQNFVERTEKNFQVQQIDVVDNLKAELRSALKIILNNPLLEAFLPQIILNQKDLTKYVIDLLMDKLIIDRQNKILQILVNLITNQELKQLYYQNNKKKPLMREILNMCMEERFHICFQNDDLQQQTFKIIVDLYKNGLISKPQLLVYVKQSLQSLFTQISKKEIDQISDCSIMRSLKYVQSQIEILNKVKDHELYGIEKTIKQIFNQQYNWFDIDNLITMETLGTILNVLTIYDKK